MNWDTIKDNATLRKHMLLPENYSRDGYILCENLLDISDFYSIDKELLECINKFFKCNSTQSESWVNYAINNPNIVSDVYDLMRDNRSLIELGKSPKIVNIVNQLISSPVLYKKIPFRIDVPFQTKELAYWHQDDFYVQGNANELTLWIPLQDTSVLQGCLSIMPGSHSLGPIPHTIEVGKKSLPKDVYSREINLIEMNRNDCLFFSSYLIHTSNLNISKKIRYSIQLRYSSAESPLSKIMEGTVHVQGNTF